jgi:hypothetical protein
MITIMKFQSSVQTHIPLGSQLRWSEHGVQEEAGTKGSCHKSFGSRLFCTITQTPKSELLKIENFAMANNWKIIIELDSLYNYKLATYSSKYIIYLCQGMCSQCQHPCIISLLGFFTLTILVPFSLKKINMRKAKNLFVAKQHRPCLDKQLN